MNDCVVINDDDHHPSKPKDSKHALPTAEYFMNSEKLGNPKRWSEEENKQAEVEDLWNV